jgi:hypothetical protein
MTELRGEHGGDDVETTARHDEEQARRYALADHTRGDHSHDRPDENPECSGCNPQLVDLPSALGDLTDPSWQDDASILATAFFFGVPHHVILFRVRDDDDEGQTLDAPSDGNDGDRSETSRAQWADACALYDGRWHTVDLSDYGVPGEWVIVAHPYGD